jgi:hypothetical protein
VSPLSEPGGGIQDGCTREIETEGGGVEIDHDDSEVDHARLEVKDGGGMLEVDGSVLWARGLWSTCLRSMVASSRSGMRRWRALRLGSRQPRTLRLGSRTIGGGGAIVSRVTEERKPLAVSKNC